MALKRVIPCLDVNQGRVVKGTNFINLRDAGDPVELAERYDAEGADELVFLDITASHEGRDTIVELARRTADNVFIPFTIGGGIRSVADAQAVLDAGADKVSVNSAALARPELLTELAENFGTQCVVVAIDAKKVAVSSEPPAGIPGREAEEMPVRVDAKKVAVSSEPPAGIPGREAEEMPVRVDAKKVAVSSEPPAGIPGREAEEMPVWDVYINGGRKPAGRGAIEWAREAVERGAGEILLTSMDRDGTNDGYDLGLTRAVADAVSVPVIASGGAGKLEHLVEAITEGHADAALCASIFHYGHHTVAEAKAAMSAAGILVRT